MARGKLPGCVESLQVETKLVIPYLGRPEMEALKQMQVGSVENALGGNAG